MSYESWSRQQAEFIDQFKSTMKSIDAKVFTIYVCSICGYTNRSWFSIAQHIHTAHKELVVHESKT